MPLIGVDGKLKGQKGGFGFRFEVLQEDDNDGLPNQRAHRDNANKKDKNNFSGRSQIEILDHFLIDLIMSHKIEDLLRSVIFFFFSGRSHFEILDNFL